jgi:hypothetical protein
MDFDLIYTEGSRQCLLFHTSCVNIVRQEEQAYSKRWDIVIFKLLIRSSDDIKTQHYSK